MRSLHRLPFRDRSIINTMNVRRTILPLTSLIAICTGSLLADGVKFDRAFAPQGGLVSRYEEPARQEICLNGSWRFQGTVDLSVPGDTAPQLGAWDKVRIKIPSPWNVNAFSMAGGLPGGDFRAYPSYPKEWEHVPAAWMQRSIKVPSEWDGKQIVLHFGAVAGKMIVYVNGQRVGAGFDIVLAQDFDVTRFVQPGRANQIMVKVIGSKPFDQPGSYGRRGNLAGSDWGTFISGIWQDVYLLAEPKTFISEVYVQSKVDEDQLTVEATLINRDPAPAVIEIMGGAREWINQDGPSVSKAPEGKGKLAANASLDLPGQALTLAPGETRVVTMTTKVRGRLKSWTPEAPNLYGLILKLSSNGENVDTKYQRLAWGQLTAPGSQRLP